MKHLSHSILLLICLTVLFASFVMGQEKQSDDLFKVKVDGKYGFIDKTGKIVIEPQFEAVNDFSDGLSEIYVRGKFNTAYIDKTGKIVIKPQHFGHDDFSDGLASVILEEGKSGFIDVNGSVVLKPNFGKVDDFRSGLAEVCESYDFDAKCGYIDKLGNIIWQPTN